MADNVLAPIHRITAYRSPFDGRKKNRIPDKKLCVAKVPLTNFRIVHISYLEARLMPTHPAQTSLSDQSPRLAVGEANPHSERVCVQAFLLFLEERRALNALGARLRGGDVTISVQKIADESEWYLGQLEDQSPGAVYIRNIANACRYFVSQNAATTGADLYIMLGALRLFIGEMIAKLSLAYDVSGGLPAVGMMPALESGGANLRYG